MNRWSDRAPARRAQLSGDVAMTAGYLRARAAELAERAEEIRTEVGYLQAAADRLAPRSAKRAGAAARNPADRDRSTRRTRAVAARH